MEESRLDDVEQKVESYAACAGQEPLLVEVEVGRAGGWLLKCKWLEERWKCGEGRSDWQKQPLQIPRTDYSPQACEM